MFAKGYVVAHYVSDTLIVSHLFFFSHVLIEYDMVKVLLCGFDDLLFVSHHFKYFYDIISRKTYYKMNSHENS